MKFKIVGVEVHISLLFALGLCLAAISKTSQNLLFIIFSSLLHELAHLLMLLSYKEKPKIIKLGIFGMEICRRGSVQLSYHQEIALVLAGPAINLFLALTLLLLGFLLHSDFFFMPILTNLALALMNLLPITPLDGGQALYFLLCTRLGENQARAVVEKIGIITLFPLFLAAFSILIQSRYNYSLLIVCLYLSMFLIFGEKRATSPLKKDK